MTVLGAAAAVVVAFIILIIIVKRFLYICGPHEVLVFAGRKHRLKDGTVSNHQPVGSKLRPSSTPPAIPSGNRQASDRHPLPIG